MRQTNMPLFLPVVSAYYRDPREDNRMTIHWQTLAFEQLSLADFHAVARLRQDVFIVEQNCPYPDLDGLDPQCQHMIATENDTLLAYQRCLPPGLTFPQSALGRIVVAPEGRGRQLGRELVQRGIDFNRDQWPGSGIQIGAQAHLEAFYASLGFEVTGEPYVEDGIPHVHMILD